MASYVEHVVVLLLGATLAWALWRNSRPRPVFTVRIVAGRPAAVDGAVTPAFLARVREAAAAHAIAEAHIGGYDHDGLIRLQFSRDVPEAARQQIRNWWAMHGWGAPRHAAKIRCG